MSSLVFYYASAEPTLIESDHIAIADPASEAAHEFSADGRLERSLSSAFRGDDSDREMDAIGIEATRTSFRVAIDPANRGVRLRRLADIAVGRQAALVRLRPVLMTSAATICGHFPLVLVTGAGAAARNSIGITIVAGMAIGTIFTLLVIPAIYVLIAKQHIGEEPGALARDFADAERKHHGEPVRVGGDRNSSHSE